MISKILNLNGFYCSIYCIARKFVQKIAYIILPTLYAQISTVNLQNSTLMSGVRKSLFISVTVLYSLFQHLIFLKLCSSALRVKSRWLHHLHDCPEHFALPRGVLPRRLFHRVGALLSTSVGARLSASTDALGIFIKQSWDTHESIR